MAFKLIKEQTFPDRKMTVSIFEHDKTGAKHYHTSYDTEENTFYISFDTLPKDNTGVPHIVEHIVLNGSRKFNTSNLYFDMQGRNLETFMNAMTSLQSTKYPFSTIDKQGFFNLLDVYTDSVFFPKLDKNSFLREGWRLEINDEEGKENVGYTGVVLNEMLGTFSSPDRVLYSSLMNDLYKGTRYGNNSGGYPLAIPDLSYEEFLAFHKQNYHPSNSTFYTFGSIPALEIQNHLEENIFKEFTYQTPESYNPPFKMPEDKVIMNEHPGESGVFYTACWKIPPLTYFEDFYEITLINQLLNSGKNSISDKLLNYGNCSGFSMTPSKIPFLTMDIETEENKIEDIKKSMQDYFIQISDGISQEEFDNIFDRIKRARRSEGGAGFGLGIISQYETLRSYGIHDLENTLDISIYQKVKEKLSNPEYFKNRIQDLFINNILTVEQISKANPDFNKNLQDRLNERAQADYLKMTQEQILSTKKDNAALSNSLNKKVDINFLPKISLKEMEMPQENSKKIKTEVIETITTHSYPSSNNMVEFSALFPFNSYNKEEFFKQYLAISLMSELPFKNKSLEESNLERETYTSIPSISFNNLGDKFYWTISLNSTSENVSHIIEKIKRNLNDIDFDQKEIIESKVSNYIQNFIHSSKDNLKINVSDCKSSIIPNAKYYNLLQLDFFTDFLNKINKNVTDELIQDLKDTYHKMFAANPQTFIISNEKDYIYLQKETPKLKGKGIEVEGKVFDIIAEESDKIYDFNSKSNIACIAYPVDSIRDKNGAALLVFQSIVKDYLIKNIRLKNGAYGAGASYDTDGAMVFYSYRDPEIQKSIDLITHLKDQDLEFTEEMLEISKINTLKSLKIPLNDSQTGNTEFVRLLKGHFIPKDQLAQSILQVSLDDINNLVKGFVDPQITISTSEIDKINLNHPYHIKKPLENFNKSNVALNIK